VPLVARLALVVAGGLTVVVIAANVARADVPVCPSTDDACKTIVYHLDALDTDVQMLDTDVQTGNAKLERIAVALEAQADAADGPTQIAGRVSLSDRDRESLLWITYTLAFGLGLMISFWIWNQLRAVIFG